METISLSEMLSEEPLPNELVEQLMADDMLPEYEFDYTQARLNRFATAFPTAQPVNGAF